MSHAAYHPVLDPTLAPPFPQAALPVLRNPQLRKNVAHAIDVIQAKRAKLVAEKTDWQELRSAASAIRAHALKTWAPTSSNLKHAAPPPGARFTGPPTPPRPAGSFSICCARRTPPKSSRSRP